MATIGSSANLGSKQVIDSANLNADGFGLTSEEGFSPPPPAADNMVFVDGNNMIFVDTDNMIFRSV